MSTVGAPTLSRIEWDAITFVHLYHDGPLTGLCTFEGRIHYFDIDPESDGERLYVYPLSNDEVYRELMLRRLFEEHVGTYWSYDLPQAEQQVRRPSDHAAFVRAAAERYPDFDLTAGREEYTRRPAVAVIASYED